MVQGSREISQKRVQGESFSQVVKHISGKFHPTSVKSVKTFGRNPVSVPQVRGECCVTFDYHGHISIDRICHQRMLATNQEMK